MKSKIRSLYWIGQTHKDLSRLPSEIIEAFVHGLRLAQEGALSPHSKPLKGFGGASVIELVESDKSGTYRAVYTVKIKDAVYVLHVFQKKSKHGIETPKKDIELIKSRLRLAQEFNKRERSHEKEI